MKRLVYIITVMIALWQTLPVLAVTDKEMEQARVIATQTYLRYANDGSGYLDALHPKTMAELEKSLKAKEKENIKAFKAIPVPTGYASWDKQKLVEYWSTTAFAHAGLEKKGIQAGKSAARKKLNNMKVAAPAAASAPAETKPEQTADPKTAETAEKPKAAAADASQPAETGEALPVTQAALDSAQAELDETKALAQAAFDEEDPMIKKENSHTWIYVVVLCILVAVVVALVVFASNVMKKSGGRPQWDPEISDESKALARSLKNANDRIEELEHHNQQLKKRVEALTAEITKLRARPAQTQTSQTPILGIPYPKTPATSEAQASQKPAEESIPAQAATPKQAQPHPVATQPAQQPSPAPQRQQPKANPQHPVRTIYLGRANAKQVFIRADRTFNPGNSVYRLDTSDGMAGTFKVVSDPSIIELVRQHPAEMLSAACVGPDLGNTENLQSIVTDSAGTAIFEGGRWIVMRKAKIHYE